MQHMTFYAKCKKDFSFLCEYDILEFIMSLRKYGSRNLTEKQLIEFVCQFAFYYQAKGKVDIEETEDHSKDYIEQLQLERNATKRALFHDFEKLLAPDLEDFMTDRNNIFFSEDRRQRFYEANPPESPKYQNQLPDTETESEETASFIKLDLNQPPDVQIISKEQFLSEVPELECIEISNAEFKDALTHIENVRGGYEMLDN